MGQCIQINGAGAVADPKAPLAGSLKAGIVALTFSAQSVSLFETGGIPVNGKAAVRGNGIVLGAAPVILSIVPVLVVTGTAKFLACASIVRGLAVLMHGKAGVADKAARGQPSRFLALRSFSGITAPPS